MLDSPTLELDDSDDDSLVEVQNTEASRLHTGELYHVSNTFDLRLVPSIRPRDDVPKDTWTVLRTRSKYYFPVLQWLPSYSFNLFTGDLLAGLTLSCLMIPQALSYATALCKLEAVHGLYAIAFPAITYALFGMSR
jgi:hypothetical protein